MKNNLLDALIKITDYLDNLVVVTNTEDIILHVNKKFLEIANGTLTIKNLSEFHKLFDSLSTQEGFSAIVGDKNLLFKDTIVHDDLKIHIGVVLNDR